MPPTYLQSLSSELSTTDRAGLLPGRPVRVGRCLSAVAIAAVPLCGMAGDWQDGQWARSFVPERTTSLIELHQGSDLSSKVRAAKAQGFETAVGDTVAFAPWYSTRWTDVRVSWLTQISRSTGIIWGLNTGERGAKYSISPGLKLGFIHQERLGPTTVLMLRATTTLGTRLREKTCTADYGDIGGVQTVNCRLAATELAPEETLAHLFNQSSRDQRQISISFQHAF